MRIKDEEHKARVVAAARLAAHGRDQKSIANRLHISQAGVSRLLREAEDSKWLVRHLTLIEERIPKSTRDAADLLLFPDNLMKRVQARIARPQLRHIALFESRADNSGNDPDERLLRFGRAAAPRVAQLLRATDVAAVTWGTTIHQVIDGLAGLSASQFRKEPIEFLPLCCEPLGITNAAVSSSRLVVELNRIVNRGRGESHSFTGIPAFVPDKFKSHERAAVEKLIRCVPSYARIFPPERVGKRARKTAEEFLIHRVRMVLTSVGRRALGFAGDQLTKSAGIGREELERLVIGDIGGVLLPKPDLTPSERRRVAEWSDRWTGVKREHLEAIARDSNDDDPGVIVAAIGEEKADVILETIEQGLVNELLIDRELGEAIAGRLKRRSRR